MEWKYLLWKVHLYVGSFQMNQGIERALKLMVGLENPNLPIGSAVIFMNRKRDMVKVFYRDNSGIWECAKKIDGHNFRVIPRQEPVNGFIEVEIDELRRLLLL